MSLRVDLSLERGDFELELAFEAEPGERLALLGPNGAGKSTLLAALAGLAPLQRGEIVLGEHTLERAPDLRLPPQAREVGVLFQGLALFEHLSALDNVAYGPRARKVPRARARAEAREWLARLGLEGPLLERRPSQLSGGEAQRVALARALITNPRLLLLDEPLAALDAHSLAGARELLATVLGEFRGVSVLVTHSLDDVRELADRLLVLEGGRVVEQGAPAQLLDTPRSAHLRAMMRLPAG